MKRKFLTGLGAVLLLFLILAGGFFYLLTARVHGQYFNSNGVRIHYTVDGEGPPLVLIHGLAANADINWRRPGIVSDLAQDFQVIAFDLRGHGLSGTPHDPEQYGVKLMHDVPRLLDHLGIESAHMAGYSLGGFILLKLMAEHPERVRSAALCAAGWKDPTDNKDILSPYKSLEDQWDRVPEEFAAVLPLPYQFGIVDWIRDYVGDQLGDVKALKACREKMGELAVSAGAVRNIDIPTICFIGTDDGLRPYAYALDKRMPGLELVELEGANHITTALRPRFQQGLQAFFLQHAEQAK